VIREETISDKTRRSDVGVGRKRSDHPRQERKRNLQIQSKSS
jgi:hypothetical protein